MRIGSAHILECQELTISHNNSNPLLASLDE